MKKNILVLGAGRGQVDLIEAATKYGLHPIVASIKGNYPGLKMGVEWFDADIRMPEEILALAKEKKIAGITTACLDYGVPSIGYVCDQMGLSGLTTVAAERCNNKLLMKDAFAKNGVNTARYKKICSENELYDVIAEIGCPIIIKSIDLQGSRGINIVWNEKDALAGYQRTMAETKESFCIVEEFIDGYEFGAQAFVAEGEVLFVLPCGDIVFSGNTNIPIGHYVPIDLDEGVRLEAERQVRAAIVAVGLNNCAVNVDLIYKDGKIYVIELTGRIGANCLPQLTSIYYGIDIYKMILDMAIGNNPKEYFLTHRRSPSAGYARMLFSECDGVLKEIINHNCADGRIKKIQFFVKPGDRINAFSNSKDCIGEVVVTGDSFEECKELIDQVISNLEIRLEEDCG